MRVRRCEPGPWLEFHNDQCIVPPNATVLARNALCVQAFAVGRHLAVQFHPEVDGAQVRRWLDDGGARAAQRAGQDPAALAAQSEALEPAAEQRGLQVRQSRVGGKLVAGRFAAVVGEVLTVRAFELRKVP